MVTITGKPTMEHNHTEQTLEQLDRRGKELSAAIRGNYLNEERKAQVQSELSKIAFELWHRYNEDEFEFVEVDKMGV
jgi:hypothetical protein